MDAYARHGAHMEAIRAAARHDFFSESMFVRFRPYDARGAWKGRQVDLGDAPTGSGDLPMGHA
jgi:spheroidene monooxygenase